MASDGEQATTLDDIKQLLKDLSDKTDRQQQATDVLSEKLVSFQDSCNTQFTTLTSSYAEIRLAHNAYADRVDTRTAGTLRTTGARGRLDFHELGSSESPANTTPAAPCQLISPSVCRVKWGMGPSLLSKTNPSRHPEM